MSNNQTNLQPISIFIPDISGFTKFINSVEIEHSTHIISELLEVLIKSNNLKFKVSEIEGDAVLFYRLGTAPTVDEIILQTEEMYLEFHRHLKYYQRDRICQCGACSNTSLLDLKFVFHYGKTVIKIIGKHEKLLGPDITTAHRLLKNDIKEHSYFLISSSSLENMEGYLPNFKDGKNKYEGIGEVNFKFKYLQYLKSKIPSLAKNIVNVETYSNSKSLEVTQIIKVPLLQVHRAITNVSFKPKWVFGIKSINNFSSGPEIIGGKHECILPTGTLNIEILSQSVKDGEIEYVEKSNSIKIIAPIYVIYKMKSLSKDETKVVVKMLYKKVFFTTFFLDLPLRIMSKRSLSKSLQNLNSYLSNTDN